VDVCVASQDTGYLVRGAHASVSTSVRDGAPTLADEAIVAEENSGEARSLFRYPKWLLMMVVAVVNCGLMG
jgi:hypothetical protein